MNRRIAVAVAVVLATAAFLSFAAIRHGFFDLKVYYGAINYWVHDGGQIYDWLKPNSKYGYTYPPFAALAMLPMAFVSWPVAIVLSCAAAVVTTGLLVYWLVDPIARREGWTRWFTFAIAACLVAAFEPLRETFSFGQVNTLLLFLVAADLLWLAGRGHRAAGVGIGLATAVKLTPGIFILYLLITRRWRAAITASATAAGATLLAAALAPDASRQFWTEMLWNTDRVGSLSFVSNQSLQGVVARLDPVHPSTILWLALVVATLAVWVWRVRGADVRTGLALTGVVGCLISPVTWVHHLVWLLPALILLVDRAIAARDRRLIAFAVFAYGMLISRFVWIWERGSPGVSGFVGSNMYVWLSIALLLLLPIPDRSGGPPLSDWSSAEADQQRTVRA
ncbi:glycosyltransferase 87 family protein [Phytohabitans sp. ZYX-F-186]|uniref:Glycosyltransferase 87 family protein n=2 Tax=Phytohabitans maris TaxID=3071409 RepID=A0ABU0Z9T4_9ACTN|nr:glycosyltransferase 87 family protein [Phytohabitans sp. ZYX-F-186]MDQ7903219.1 glycosyltransferase 87 family protein [Phytohabitans sp. ZYX-F-186]